ncbi:hypothetical protein BDW02DRAFT_504140 [Decorospora gaudefroyi]|uniref:CFEM domain-containing protein n=1 Tax=Decorospora gaudefroyi TaxID=184978 RepID=A0A6A5KC15_9PLEO|nr:hypothetical protein BDW02DRAFT_504140 [Decorospora gaudefroyi]
MRLFKRIGFGSAILALSVCSVSAQQMPACATECLQSSLEAQTTCAPSNVTCICTTETLMSTIQGCVLSSCTLIQALSAQNATQTMCGQPVRDITHITPIVTGISGGLATIAVIARCLISSALALDDAFVVAALVAALPMGILEFIMSADGFGRDIWTIPADKIYRIVQFTWLTEVFYFMAVALTKMSFLCFCLRIFPRVELRRTVYILLAVCLAYGIAFTITCLFNCTPVSYIWTSWDGEHTGRCINFHIFAWAHAGINIVLDVIVLAVPIPELLRLSLSLKKKMFIIMMFSIGIFTTIVSIIRLQSLVQFATSTNPTYDNVPTAYWSVLEAFLGIFCICMPALRRFLARSFPRCFGSTQQNSDSGAADTPNKLAPRPKNSKSSVSFGKTFAGSSGITKTMETRVESRVGEEDEVMLVEMEGRGGTPGSGDEERDGKGGRGVLRGDY